MQSKLIILLSVLLILWICVIGIEESGHLSVVNKCCKPELHSCCLQSLQKNGTLQCAGSNWRATTECIEMELFNESLLKVGAENCCSLLSTKQYRFNCVDNMRKASIPIKHRLEIVEKCNFIKDEDKPDCYNDTIRRFHDCFPECVDWYRENPQMKNVSYKPWEQCDLFDKRVIYPCLKPE